MTKFYIGFGIVGVGVIALAVYGMMLVHAHPYISPLDQAQTKSSDARRLSDVRQMMTAFELFYNDCGHYPSSLDTTYVYTCESTDTYSNLSGMNSNKTSSTIKLGDYLATIPSNPTPGGMTYTYSSTSPYNSYTLKFSLEGDAGGFTAGPHTASPSGLK